MLDSSVVLKWFREESEAEVGAARSLRAEFRAGRLAVVVPPLLELELLNVAARAWRWNEARLVRLVTAIKHLGLERREPELNRVAHWAGLGLTAYDAVYVALAELAGIELITDDDLILDVAGRLATPLRDCA